MKDLKNKLTSSKSTKNITTRKGKSFGYQILGFGKSFKFMTLETVKGFLTDSKKSRFSL